MDEVDLGLHRGQVILRPALQNEARTERGEVRNAGDVEEDILRQHIGQPGKNFFGAPALALEVHDVGLHEHRAAVAEDGHGLAEKAMSAYSSTL